MQLNEEKKNDLLLYLLAFIIPTAIFLIYFACRKSDILTVDLGQQYVDFIAFFKNNLFKNPLSLIYNFNQGLGASFIATSAYYLASPLNLLLFLIPKQFLPQGILLIISLKLGLIGLSSYYLWQKNFTLTRKIFALAASLAFALSGYAVCYNLNLMWLDTLILLPLLIDAINKIFFQPKQFNYLCLITFLIWFTNFYTGYMALLFGLLYFVCQSIIQKCNKSIVKSYLTASILATLLDSFILLPTFLELLAGKVHSDTQWNLNWQFMPLNAFNKLVTGSFSFHEMSNGWPNIYFTISFFLLSLLYFFSHHFCLKEKITNFILLFLTFISLSFNPLVLITHMGQFPVWYPARGSFIYIFFSLTLALQFLKKQVIISKKQILLAIFISLLLIILWTFNLKNVAFLNSTKIIISCIFIICTILLFIFINNKYACLLFYGLIGLEVSINLILSLNAISYQKNSDYVTYTRNLSALINKIKIKDHSFYRIEKNFNHTDNDPLSDNYFGVSNFNSISNAKTITFVDSLGLKNNENSYSYQYSDLLTDSLLGIKYLIVAPFNSNKSQFNEHYYRSDLNKKILKSQKSQLQIIKNNYAFPIIMQINTPANIKLNAPATENQNNLFDALTNTHTHLFQPIFWPVAQLKNIKQDGSIYRKINNHKTAEITFNFVPDTNDTYYLELSPDITSSAASISINHNFIDNEDLGTTSKIIPLANNDQGKIIKISLSLHEKEINLGACHLYQFNNFLYKESAKSFIKKQPKSYPNSALSLKFKNHSNKTSYIKTTIPYSKNWLVFDNGKLIKTNTWLNTFLSFKLSKGTHRVKLIYIPFSFLFGILISLLALIFFLRA
ncbi:YfhO family protein [Lactobacillus hominis]|uniref:Bacterial membrane protein n=1 Tax=Lactobacillus hominis DSM 23910 = CRBIP 24.179 TaxID=1423758 RepID=I7IVP6_9LACO|nr:YfhO family protein [Lactobacillus hominis]KRM85670.1 hypothetical protein FC41_GL000984 [Lactobacillus hominis DSM 23910 = CRBIP 24.179]MCT3347281.1 ABC transporter permease [Lactobacillus hominis]CCI81808.1 Bacterial membrane protein [Lactobacillus hominis DSM 23910 = CRBIP 24.179]